MLHPPATRRGRGWGVDGNGSFGSSTPVCFVGCFWLGRAADEDSNLEKKKS